MQTDPEIIRSTKRKRIAIRIIEGRVQLLLPQRASELEAKKFLARHVHWVETQLHKYATAPIYPAKQYIDGEIFHYLGETYCLNIAYANQRTLMVRDYQFFVFISHKTPVEKHKQQIYKQLYNWYYQQAEHHLKQKSEHYAQQMEVRYTAVSVRQFKSRWGSCSSKGEIQYNWQIILAPNAVVDYLVVHELAHLRHPNHSKRFWKFVASILPDYEDRKIWLKTHGHQLRIV